MVKQKGFLTSWWFTIFMLLLGAGFYFYAEENNKKVLDSIATNAPVLSADGMKIVEDYRSKPTPVSHLNGLYKGDTSVAGSLLGVSEFSMSFYFGTADTITKTVTVAGKKLTGSAKYSFAGSTLVYSDVNGAQGLFNREGEAFEIDGDMLLLPSASTPITLLSLLSRTKSTST